MRLEYVYKINKCYDDTQGIIGQYECSASVKLTRQFAEVRRTDANRRLSTIHQFFLDESPSHASSPKTKVPEIQLLKFPGSCSECPNFFALFSIIVNDNSFLSKLIKFHYLRANVEGVALGTIASLKLKEANYDEAVILLKYRFDNKLLNFQIHINGLWIKYCRK